MTSPRMMFSALALSSVALLSGCSKPVVYEGISEDVFKAMHTQPADSYSLVPVVRLVESDKSNTPVRTQVEGRFNVIVKTGDLQNQQAFSTDGKPGTMLCSSFKILSGSLDETGRMNVDYSYWRSGGRSGWYEYVSAPVSPNGKTIKVPESIDYNGRTAALVAKPHKICQFTPAA